MLGNIVLLYGASAKMFSKAIRKSSASFTEVKFNGFIAGDVVNYVGERERKMFNNEI